VGGGRELVGVIAEAEFDAAEQLSVRSIDKVLGHLAEGVLGGGPQLAHEGTDTGFTVIRGR